MVVATGSEQTRLVILRGNSGSGKTSVAMAVRAHLGRTCALVQQDVIRRTILRERDVPDGANIGLIARYALDQGYHVIIEGILWSAHYAAMLTELADDHRGVTTCYYLDVSWDETVRRHAGRPQSSEFGPEHMRSWYRPHDVLGLPDERIVPETLSLEHTTARVLDETFAHHRTAPVSVSPWSAWLPRTPNVSSRCTSTWRPSSRVTSTS
jgi:predicted kinase